MADLRYRDFLASKEHRSDPTGFEPAEDAICADLFAFQLDIVRWALRRGRAAVFADTGLGKTRIELAWAAAVSARIGRPVLVLAPLAVASQTAREGARIGIPVNVCREANDVQPGVNITNYDRLHKFSPRDFAGVVLDESSCLKHHGSSTRAALTEAWSATPFRLAATATPAPNDYMELGNHAEFLGVMTRQEMLATFFCHDGGETQVWRLKGHAEEAFWRWVCAWAVAVRVPSDLGYDDGGYILPKLTIKHHVVTSKAAPKEPRMLFALPALDLTGQRVAKRASLADRVAKVAEIVSAEPKEPWLIWCDLNDEGDALEEEIASAVQIAGADSFEVKEERMLGFTEGRIRVLVTKGSVAGFGMNWQHCARMAFVGVTHSYEQFYQSVRRCYRFGQTRPVVVHVVASEMEAHVVASLQRKQADAARLTAAMVSTMRETQLANVRGLVRESVEYQPQRPMQLPAWLTSEGP